MNGAWTNSSLCLDIENRINDSISPKPDFELEIDEENKMIRLIVHEGENQGRVWNAV